MQFREDGGFSITYDVGGVAGSAQFPYRHDIPSLKEAVAIARTYPGVYLDGAATHITRQYTKPYHDGKEARYLTYNTHRWRVDPAGNLQLIVNYRHGRGPTCRLDPAMYLETLSPMPNRATTLQGELVDLAAIAKRIGLDNAAIALLAHVYGRRRLQEFEQFTEHESSGRVAAFTPIPDSKPIWRRALQWLISSKPSFPDQDKPVLPQRGN